MAAAVVENVELGFVEKIDDKWKLLSHFFPSKVGGFPAWLALKDVPLSEDIKCKNCQSPCVFLMQVYAPIESFDCSFHRTLFMFVCKDANCSKQNDNQNLTVLRCQLGRENPFYSSEPPDLSSNTFDWQATYPKANDFQPLCRVCGCAGPKKCGTCQKANYCSREHQITDWKHRHKQEHQAGQSTIEQDLGNREELNRLLFPEYELVTEPEPPVRADAEKSEETKMAEYKDFMKSAAGREDSLLKNKDIEADLEKMASSEEEKVDAQFMEFKTRISLEPEQVLRYQRNGRPLWVGANGQLSPGDVPDCSCGAPRIFEFQIMPQLLNHLGVDSLKESLDWGTLVVYSCKNSCQTSSHYNKEFVWKQVFSNHADKT